MSHWSIAETTACADPDFDWGKPYFLTEWGFKKGTGEPWCRLHPERYTKEEAEAALASKYKEIEVDTDEGMDREAVGPSDPGPVAG